MNIGTACCHSPDCADRECEGRPDPDLLRQCLASGQADSRQIAAHLAAGDVAEDRDEPLTDPDYMLALTALTGVLAVACIAGGLIWLVYSILPVLRAHFA